MPSFVTYSTTLLTSEAQIERMLHDRASDLGISVEELKQQLLAEAKYVMSSEDAEEE